MAWPPPLRPRLVSIAGRDEAAGREAARRYGFERVRDGLARARLRPGRAALRQRRAEQPARRADDRRRRGRQARLLREAARPHRRRELRDLAASRRRRRQAHVRLQLPVRPGGPARARDASKPASSARSTTSAAAICRSGATTDGATPGASTRTRPGSGALGDLGAHVIDLARYLVGEIASVSATTRTFMPGREVDDAFEAVVEFEGRRGRDDRGDPLRGRPEERVQLGDQRLEGLARVRPRAPQRAPALSDGHAGLPHDPRVGARPSLLAVVVAARPHDRLGAHLRARDPTPADARSPGTATWRRTARRSRTGTGRPRSATRSSAPARRERGRRCSTGEDAALARRHGSAHDAPVSRRPRRQPAPADRASRSAGGCSRRADHGGRASGRRGRCDPRRRAHAARRRAPGRDRRRVPADVLAHGLHLRARRYLDGRRQGQGHVPQ